MIFFFQKQKFNISATTVTRVWSGARLWHRHAALAADPGNTVCRANIGWVRMRPPRSPMRVQRDRVVGRCSMRTSSPWWRHDDVIACFSRHKLCNTKIASRGIQLPPGTECQRKRGSSAFTKCNRGKNMEPKHSWREQIQHASHKKLLSLRLRHYSLC